MQKAQDQIHHSLRIAKCLYYDRKFIETKSNMGTTCRLLKEVVTRKKSKSRPNSAFRVDSKEVSDPAEIASRFCQFFSNIGPNQAKRV